MSAAEMRPTFRRLSERVRAGKLPSLDPAAVRLVLRTVLFGGAGVPAWHVRAACRDHDAELFFPEPDVSAAEQVAEAKRVCASCPVRAWCLADVMAREQPTTRHGVRGGLSVAERHQLHRQQDQRQQQYDRELGGEGAA
jgi:WhiB family redox-sensing transcriptional regulator